MALDRFQIKGKATCRIVYPHGLFKKTLVKGAEDKPENYKYNALIFVPKDDTEKIEQINERYMEAFEELRNKGFAKKTPAGINPKNNCWVDGDVMADEEENKEAFRGYMILKVASKNVRPIVTALDKRAIINGVPNPKVSIEQVSDETLEDGDYIGANVSFWTYLESSFQGIGCNINAIVRVKAGERIGGASDNVEDYIDTSDYE